MPLVNGDVKGLEVVVAADLFDDQVLKDEILRKVDIHGENQKAFKLGEGKPGRLVAKILKFRIIYGGGAWSFAHDPDFMGVSTSVKFWQSVIDAYYEKYAGIRKGHARIVEEAKINGFLTIPSGHYFEFKPSKNYKGEWEWPVTQIKNYPVQGFGAALVMLARIEFFRRFKASGLEGCIVQTIHDSIVVDTPSKNCYTIGMMLQECVEAVQALCKEKFNYPFSLPLTCETSMGPNKRDLKEFNPNASNS